MEHRVPHFELAGAPFTTADAKPLLAVVERLYDAAEHPERLRDALAAVTDLVGAGSVLLLVADGADRRLVSASHGPARLAQHHHNLPLSSESPRTVPLAAGFELVFDRLDSSPGTMATLAELRPHLVRALRLGERLGARPGGQDLTAVDLDRLPIGVVLLGLDGTAVAINRAARAVLSAATAIGLEARRLTPRPAVQRAMLESLVERLVAPPQPGRRFVGGRLLLTDETWGEVDLLLARFDSRFEGESVHALAVVSASGAAVWPEARFVDLLGLDAEEARLAVALVLGREPAEGAGHDASQERIRALYGKLGTTRQSDLVRLLLRPPGVVFEAADRIRAS